MASGRVAWGIDIGNRALKAVELARDGEQLRVVDIDVIEHEQILSSAGDNKESMIQSAIAHFVERHNIKKIPVAIGVSGQSSFARFIKLPPVEPKKVPEIIRFEAIQQIPFPLEEVEWAYQLFETPDSPDVEVGIFAMRRELVNRQISYFKSAGMTVSAVQMNPLAVYNAMQYDQRVQNGTTMLVDVGAENTDLIIADGQTVWLRTLPIGGNNFTESLAKAFKVNFAKAEDLKRSASTSRYAKQIFQAMRPVFGDLVAEIQRSIGFYASVHRDSRIKKIVALGGTFRLPTLQKYLQQNLQLDVERLDGFASGAPEDGRVAALLNDNLISMVGAYGLAIQAMGDAKINSSLLPAEIRRERVWKEKTKWFATAAALFLVGAGAVGAKWYVENSKFDGEATVRTQVNTTEKQVKQMDDLWKQISSPSDVDKRITNLDALPHYRNLWPTLLNDIASRTPRMYGSREQIMKTPRADRRQLFIEDVNCVYVSFMSPFLTATESEFIRSGSEMLSAGRASMPIGTSMSDPLAGRTFGLGMSSAQGRIATASNENKNLRGFLLDIRCTSPNKDNPTFVNDQFLNRLKLINEDAAYKEGKPYYIARVVYLLASPLIDDKQFKQQWTNSQQLSQVGGNIIGAEYIPGAAQGASLTPVPGTEGLPPPPGPGRVLNANGESAGIPAPSAVPDENSPLRDPMTGELRDKDWIFDVLVAVVLDPQPTAPGQAAPGRRPAAPVGPPIR